MISRAATKRSCDQGCLSRDLVDIIRHGLDVFPPPCDIAIVITLVLLGSPSMSVPPAGMPAQTAVQQQNVGKRKLEDVQDIK
jgi:hypothetical protein